ncbi:uncharacterized protein LOC125045960 [Penaeus chinensis]|uniref:uncharacterized protein LOC125045960 n=1 Tax=Penaeus chinensis TaxID=139456 RepID=UPI001FB83EC5|nr:uncharacterized protein LOC125045960 [Penaeus chinensis]
MKASREVSVKQKRSRSPPRAVRPPRFPAATSSGCPSPSRSERSGWWDQQQLSPVSCASGYWDDEQPLRDWDVDEPRHERDDVHRISPESEGSGESERLRALFTACDTDGDGYITSANLAGLLSMLGLEGSGETLARELGADRRGRVSLRAFLARRKQLAQEVNAIRSEGGENWAPELWSGGSEGGDCDPLSPQLPSSPFSRQQQGGRGTRQDHHHPAGGRRQQLPYTSRQVLEATNKVGGKRAPLRVS